MNIFVKIWKNITKQYTWETYEENIYSVLIRLISREGGVRFTIQSTCREINNEYYEIISHNPFPYFVQDDLGLMDNPIPKENTNLLGVKKVSRRRKIYK